MNENFSAVVEDLKNQYKNETPQSGVPPDGAPQPPPNLTQGIDISPDDAERLFATFINYPYEALNTQFKTDEFTLSDSEKQINAILIKFMVLYYLPMIDLGKWSLWLFLIFNGALIFGKYTLYKEKEKAKIVKPKDSPAVVEKSAEKENPKADAGVTNKSANNMINIIEQGKGINE